MIQIPVADIGAAAFAANLAIVFSQLGERTLLIDADLRTPRQHELFKLGSNAGLTGLLAGNGGTMSQAEMLAYAAVSSANQVSINLIGLQQTGVEYA